MNYIKLYSSIIERSKLRTLDCYTESHHIIPRCIGGSDLPENLAKLTAREHYIVHRLLLKIYPDERGLIFAFHMMSSLNNRKYEWLRILHSELQSKTAKVGHKTNPNYGMSGKNHSDESKLRMSLANKKPAKLLRCTKCGITGGENNLLRYHFDKCGMKLKTVACPHCQKEVSSNIAKRWHFDNCKQSKPS